MCYPERFDAILKLYGEEVVVHQGQAQRSIRAFFRPLDMTTVRTHFDDS